MTPELTEWQCEQAIANALHAGDITAVGDFLRYMAGRYPQRAGELLKTMEVGLFSADERTRS